MKQFNTINDDLLVKYLVNETDAAETAEVEKWIYADNGNKQHFEQLLLIWEQSLRTATAVTVNRDEVWHRLQQRIRRNKNEKNSKHGLYHQTNRLRAAAAIFIIALAGWLSYMFITNNTNEPVAVKSLSSNNQIITETLPDGSVITVNKHATLSYPSAFSDTIREVSLKGEAFFNITPDKSKPFIIHVNDVTVRVVGTSFNIKSEGGKTEVIVETGIVQVSKNKHTVKLLPKEKIITQWQNSALVKDRVKDQLYNYYRSKEFICNNTPLQNLVQTLNEAYNANIVIENEDLKNLPITTVFKEESLDNILAVISETFNIHADKTNDKIILR